MDRPAGDISREELQLAARNAGMPQEALAYDLTPVGLHYLLIHYDVPEVDAEAWRLRVDGAVGKELELSLEDLRERERRTVAVTMECAGNGRTLYEPRAISQPWLLDAVGTAEWTGTPLLPLLDEAGVDVDAVELVFTGLDRGIEGGEEQTYARSLPFEEVRRDELLLADEMNGAPLLPQHGAPLRLVVPGWYGMASVKWLARITPVRKPFDGYQNRAGYRTRQVEEDPGEPVTRIVPRSLMVPPGIPEFLTRSRHVSPGAVTLRGRAWSGWGPIERVEVSTDGGATWNDARIDQRGSSDRAWVGWSFDWNATEGEHVLASRATDATGRTQPDQAEWNLGGYANNGVQRVPVTVSAEVGR
jgi:DMSO/TMAO reductase YedYZ molybdopterin-dependent catalytic subunit